MALRIMKCIGVKIQTQKNTPLKLATGRNSSNAAHSADTEREVQHLAKFALDWWNENGQMRPLHALNEIRVPFIRDGLIACSNINPLLLNTTRVLQDQNILEVGCGPGILTEPLGRLAANVTGIDLGEEVTKVARDHLANQSLDLQKRISYKIEPVEEHAKDNLDRYDAVVVSEVLEHVNEKVALLTACVKVLKPGGSIFITTQNKTIPLWVLGVFVAEYILNVVPRNTHHWNKFISPADLERILDSLNCQTVLVNGSTYDFWCNTWRWINSTNMCYALQAIKIDS